ncbi:LGFP repeat-containing protein [Mycolicibacterium frederiksbergense]|uniref:LGFP repeat-containing protein n=1 Tax=Mycolicibacterium frederiksbergense TaxID=117567 RepID=UPI00265B8C43|nr:hypothetical protein [Mycolicibacterium frederiksbergense]MBX9921390.1 hypothetical protein [Mycolicibacterium frederiksbergense]MDO0974771.1 hypothetical protein [Mycolicibacterium frederiksbergense]
MTIATKRNASIASAILGFALIGSGCQAAQDTADEAASSASSVGSSVSSAVDAPDATTTAPEPTTTGAAPGTGTDTEETTIAGADGTEYTVSGPVLAKYNTLDEAGKNALGAPTGEQQANPDGGVYQQFDGGVIIHSAAGSHVVWGKIRDKWNELGGSQGELGYPTSDETDTAEGNKQTTFERGTVTWNPTTDEVVVTMN